MKRKRILKIIGVVLAVLVFMATIGLPSVVGVVVVFPYGGSAGEPPQGFEEISLMTEDGVRLGGWYAEPQNGAVIILTHGAGQGTSGLGDHAEMLHENGFGVLALNLRGFGSSEGHINRLGWTSNPDIGAALAFLAERPEVEAVGGLGLSMGSEVLLGAASEYPTLRAVISDGATYRSLDEYIAHEENDTLLHNYQYRVLFFVAGTLSGDDAPETTIIESISAAESTQFLFIASGESDEEITYGGLFEDASNGRGHMWAVPNAGHTAGFDVHPEEYERRVVAFFTNALLAD